MRTLPPPSMVTRLPPSMTVSRVVGSSMVAVTVMVAGAAPQSKVTTPPLVSAADSRASVQDAAVPVPTTVAGWLTSAAWIGAVQTAAGGVTSPASTSAGGALASPPVTAPPSPVTVPPPSSDALPAPCGLPAEPEDPQPTASATTKTGAKRSADPRFAMEPESSSNRRRSVRDCQRVRSAIHGCAGRAIHVDEDRAYRRDGNEVRAGEVDSGGIHHLPRGDPRRRVSCLDAARERHAAGARARGAGGQDIEHVFGVGVRGERHEGVIARRRVAREGRLIPVRRARGDEVARRHRARPEARQAE